MSNQPVTTLPADTSGLMAREPVLSLASIYGVIGAAVVLLAAFGLNISQGKVHAVEAFVAVVFPLLATIHIRSAVFSPHSVKQALTGGKTG